MDEPREVFMNPHSWQRQGDKEKLIKLVDDIAFYDDTVNKDHLLGVAKLAYDIGRGVDIWQDPLASVKALHTN